MARSKYLGLMSLMLFAVSTTVFSASSNNYMRRPGVGMINPGVTTTASINVLKGGAYQVGFNISNPGYYYISADSSMAPGTTENGYSGIYINSDNVILDMGGKSLILSTTGAQPAGDIYGIKIAAGKKNITIMNGRVNGTGYTANAITNAIYIPGTSNAKNQNIQIQNVQIFNCGNNGIYAANTNNLLIEGVSVYNTASTTASKYPAALYLSACNDGVIADCNFDNSSFNASGVASSYGLYALNSNNFEARNVSASNNSVASTTESARANCFGMYLENCSGWNCANIRALRNQHVGYTDASTAVITGLVNTEVCGILLNGSRGNVFSDCKANNNSGGIAYASNYTCSTYGFKLTYSSSGNTFTNCEAKSNLAAADAAGFGLFVWSDANILDSCLSLNNTSSKDPASIQGRFAYGFTTSLCSGNYFSNCKAMKNAVLPGTKNQAYGFGLNTEWNSVVLECEASANDAGATAGGEVYGIALLGTCRKCDIEYNKIMSNIGSSKCYGFKDFSSDCTSLLRGNVSFGHGQVLSGGSATLTDSGTMNFMFVYDDAGSVMNPLNLIKEGDIANMNAFEAGSTTWFNFSILSDAADGLSN